MMKHNQMPGMTYKIISQDAQHAVLEYTYHWPHCMRKSTTRSRVYPPDYERLETGGFFESLTCSECGKSSDIRFWRTMKID